MIKVLNGNVFENNCDIIIHQVNCMGVMGSGVAKQVKERYPEVYEQYKKLCNKHIIKKEELLGKAQFVYVFDPIYNKYIYIVNLFGQKNYGKDGSIYTDYVAFKAAMNSINKQIINSVMYEKNKNIKIGIPYLIGCKRGGGNWEIIDSIINNTIGNLNVSYYKLDLD